MPPAVDRDRLLVEAAGHAELASEKREPRVVRGGDAVVRQEPGEARRRIVGRIEVAGRADAVIGPGELREVAAGKHGAERQRRLGARRAGAGEDDAVALQLGHRGKERVVGGIGDDLRPDGVHRDEDDHGVTRQETRGAGSDGGVGGSIPEPRRHCNRRDGDGTMEGGRPPHGGREHPGREGAPLTEKLEAHGVRGRDDDAEEAGEGERRQRDASATTADEGTRARSAGGPSAPPASKAAPHATTA